MGLFDDITGAASSVGGDIASAAKATAREAKVFAGGANRVIGAPTVGTVKGAATGNRSDQFKVALAVGSMIPVERAFSMGRADTGIAAMARNIASESGWLKDLPPKRDFTAAGDVARDASAAAKNEPRLPGMLHSKDSTFGIKGIEGPARRINTTAELGATRNEELAAKGTSFGPGNSTVADLYTESAASYRRPAQVRLSTGEKVKGVVVTQSGAINGVASGDTRHGIDQMLTSNHRALSQDQALAADAIKNGMQDRAWKTLRRMGPKIISDEPYKADIETNTTIDRLTEHHPRIAGFYDKVKKNLGSEKGSLGGADDVIKRANMNLRGLAFQQKAGKTIQMSNNEIAGRVRLAQGARRSDIPLRGLEKMVDSLKRISMN